MKCPECGEQVSKGEAMHAEGEAGEHLSLHPKCWRKRYLRALRSGGTNADRAEAVKKLLYQPH